MDRGFHWHKGSCGPVGCTLLSAPSGLEPVDARQRRHRAVLTLDWSHCRPSHSEAWPLPKRSRAIGPGSRAPSEKGPLLPPSEGRPDGGGGGALATALPVHPPPPPGAHKSVLESANPRMDSECASGCTWSTARATAPSPGQPTPGVVKQDKSSRGSVDTTKTRSDPRRVRRSSGERPLGAAKGKQSDTEALCQPPLPHRWSCNMNPTRPVTATVKVSIRPSGRVVVSLAGAKAAVAPPPQAPGTRRGNQDPPKRVRQHGPAGEVCPAPGQRRSPNNCRGMSAVLQPAPTCSAGTEEGGPSLCAVDPVLNFFLHPPEAHMPSQPPVLRGRGFAGCPWLCSRVCTILTAAARPQCQAH